MDKQAVHHLSLERWEYKYIRHSEPVIRNSHFEDQLKFWGNLGWELVSFKEDKHTNPITKDLCYFYSCVFKRKIQQG